jgi:DNA polymerase II large subunit
MGVEKPKEEYWDTEKYFGDLKNQVDKEYAVANEARGKGLDPVDKVEIPLAMTMAEKSVGLVATVYVDLPIQSITKRMLELEEEYGKLDTTVSFVIAREVAEGNFFEFKDQLEAIDCGIRVGFAYLTLGVVASPIEGYTGISLGKTHGGKDYFIASFSGPIRSAGTTASCLVLMLIDYLREYFGYAKYDPSEEEVKRYITENTDYHERVTNLQYFPTEEEMEFLAKNLPIQISGDPTERFEVSNYKDLDRVETNYIRGGMCLIFSEGLAQKAQKGLKRLARPKENGIVSTGWDFLEEYLAIHKKREKGLGDVTATYIKDLVAGRPVYGHPGRSGGFRFRYGRSRVAGFSAVSVHPATMGITNSFLSHGTQLKIEKPTKGCIVTSCDQIEGPIVKLVNGSVRQIQDFEESKKIYPDVEEILYLGDMLFPLGDIMDRNAKLPRPGYVEEWWELELQEKLEVTREGLRDILGDGRSWNVTLEKSIELCQKYSMSIHPKHIFYWTQVGLEGIYSLIEWIGGGTWRGGNAGKLVLPWGKAVRGVHSQAKRTLELLGVSHEVVLDNVVINEGSRALLLQLGIDSKKDGEGFLGDVAEILKKREESFENTLSLISALCKFRVRDKAGTFIGARMGRPEKAKLRRLTGSPNMLFSVSSEGGRLRSIQAAVGVGHIKSDWPIFKCSCGNETIYSLCEKCGKKTIRKYYCRECRAGLDEMCDKHDARSCRSYSRRKIDSKYYFNVAKNLLGYKDQDIPPLIKGVRGTSSEDRDFENLAKGILRAKYNLAVNKDGTVRYDGTEIPLTHFKPKEVRTSVSRLRDLGYLKDIYGRDLASEDQLLELRPHDIVLPSCPVTQDEKADDVFMNLANFVDEELERFYKMPRYYNLKSKEDLIGQLVVCIAPHNVAGVVGRIIGFSDLQGLVASPYLHATMRRDCDGDEAAVMLFMDVLLNFSRKFLPGHRGGRQDAPLVLNARISAGEVDDQILTLETCDHYPLDVYRLAEKGESSSKCEIDNVRRRLASGVDPFTNVGFTHDSSDFNLGVLNGAYKVLPTMKDKVRAQMELVSKIRAVDTEDVARLIIERHFIRDIRGNLRKFSRQQFRCVVCNEKFRRPPLIGKCTKCGGKIIFTISEGSVRKYLEPAMDLAANYNIPPNTKEGMDLTKMYIESIFGKSTEEQVRLGEWVE